MREIRIWRGIHTGAIPDGDERISIQFLTAQLEHLPSGWLPLSACNAIRLFAALWEDALDDTMFDPLKPYAQRMLGTRGSVERERRRGWLALDWLIRTNTVVWLRLVRRHDHADALANLPPQTSAEALAASAAVRQAAHLPKSDLVIAAEAPRPSLDDPVARWLDWRLWFDGIYAACNAAAGRAASGAAWSGVSENAEWVGDDEDVENGECGPERDVEFDADDAYEIGLECAREACYRAVADFVREYPGAQEAEVRAAGYGALTAVVEYLQVSAFALLDQMIAMSY